ncbi:hypothetical protein MML48_6g00010486 [Holotrichia oblita]|uniref:Uncharacterized protein n=1 Tax=Holotrichia oblita TaxID=644536 RepID=A0ACB9SXF5_HOLOL|nr:hypothetical protein MML48_6g00010486 [Holotrichia oblita]
MKALSIFVIVSILGTTFVSVALADECPMVCPLLYSPICAQDVSGSRITYGNKCEYEADSCRNPSRGLRFIKTGIAFVSVALAAKCPTTCPILYSPICAEDVTGTRITYDTKCQYEAESCRNPSQGLRFIKTGECSEL